jgi:hypothetical protein
LQKKHEAAGSAPTGKVPTSSEVDLDVLVARVGDKSRPWPEIEAELVELGFVQRGPQPSRLGIRAG